MIIDVKHVKIAVMVPTEFTDVLRNIAFEMGAGTIGNYSNCSTVSEVKGSFRPEEKAHPFIGDVEITEYVSEDRLQVICDIDRAGAVVKALKEAHPYEEPGIDIYPLIDEEDLL